MIAESQLVLTTTQRSTTVLTQSFLHHFPLVPIRSSNVPLVSSASRDCLLLATNTRLSEGCMHMVHLP